MGCWNKLRPILKNIEECRYLCRLLRKTRRGEK
jgi:hypothetical protein